MTLLDPALPAILPAPAPPVTRSGIAPAESTLAVAPNRSYTLVVSRKRDNGIQTLVVVEPSLDGHGG